MNTPQIVMIVLISIEVQKALLHFGEKKKEEQYDLFDLLIGPGIEIAILWWGGFWG